MAITKNSQIDLNGNEMILDADGDTTITADTDDQIDFKTAGTDRVAIGASGNLFVGSSTSNGISGGTAGLQVTGAGFNGAISASRHDNNQYGSSLMLGKSRNTTVGSHTIVQDNDGIGAVTFFADDGTNLDSRVANISAAVDGTPGENDTPGRLTFETTADGSAAPSERMRITSGGTVLVGKTALDNTTAGIRLNASGQATMARDGSLLYLNRKTSNGDLIEFAKDNSLVGTIGIDSTSLTFDTNGSERMKIDAAGIITKPYQPAFDVDYNGNASVADGNYLVYPNVRLNTGSHYSTSTGKFTAPVAGNYLIYWDAIGGNDDDVYRFKLHKNDAQYLQHTQLRIDTPLNQYGNGTKVMIVPLAASDTLRIYYDSDAGNTAYANDNYLTFGGHLIG